MDQLVKTWQDILALKPDRKINHIRWTELRTVRKIRKEKRTVFLREDKVHRF